MAVGATKVATILGVSAFTATFRTHHEHAPPFHASLIGFTKSPSYLRRDHREGLTGIWVVCLAQLFGFGIVVVVSHCGLSDRSHLSAVLSLQTSSMPCGHLHV
jgi:hypothetical protein